jgi:hypothetical protein
MYYITLRLFLNNLKEINIEVLLPAVEDATLGMNCLKTNTYIRIEA